MASTDKPWSKATRESDLEAGEWATKIERAWKNSVTAIFKAGDLLVEAKADLPHGKFQRVVQEILPFSERTAQRFMAISRCSYLKENMDRLPPQSEILNLLTRIGKSAFDAALEAGVIHPDMTPNSVDALFLKSKFEAVEPDARAAVLSPVLGGLVAICPSGVARNWSSELRETILQNLPEAIGWLTELERELREPTSQVH